MKKLLLGLLLIGLFAVSSGAKEYELTDFIISQAYYPGYCPNIDDYIVTWFDSDSGMTQYFVSIYDLRTNERYDIPINRPLDGAPPKISNGNIVWLEYDSTFSMVSLYAYNMVTKELQEVISSYICEGLIWPNIYHNHIVWSQCADCNCLEYQIKHYDLSSDTLSVIATLSEPITVLPDIDGNYVVFSACNDVNCDEHYIYGYDLDSNDLFIISESFNSSFFPPFMAIDNNYVVWSGCTDSNCTSGRLRGYNLSDRYLFDISNVYYISTRVNLAENYVVWTDFDPNKGHEYIYVYDLKSGVKSTVSICYSSFTFFTAPSTDGKYVVWSDYDFIDPNLYIYGYDLESQEKFIITKGQYLAFNEQPNIDDGIVIWQDFPQPFYMYRYIYGTRIFNDNCSDAEEVKDYDWYYGDNIAATGDMQSSCAFNDIRDVWYYYKALKPGEITIDLDGINFDTTLAAYNGCGGTELACNDDYSIYNTDSRINLTVVKDKTYYIRVAGFDGQTGDFQLHITRGSCSSPIEGDINGDCKVDFTDFAIMSSHWLECNLVPESACW